ncbi:hypothetical protein CPT03_16835 [Pedobacter ginsengisoli]|uniref:Uncharacterized protein n=1 Tax=Pedobacter ginsengisoli TaxID=363852 RepID=A0A2D1U8X0_9SPHI|nr:hypothetical protein [Pedobacter ginsengisoli]ATP58012.1 hypothetical protein CPT03_16835 [Pedobacter ginsengisoli]
MKRILLFLLIFCLFSCKRKVYFTDFENEILKVYTPGDTLIFESNTKKKDTSYVLDKKISYAKWNPFAHSGKYSYLNGIVYNGSEKKRYEGKPYPYVLLNLSKTQPDSTILFIHYKKAFVLRKFRDFNKATLDQFKIADSVYKFTDVYQKSGKTINVDLYWHIKYGVIKYIESDTETWQRVNISVNR